MKNIYFALFVCAMFISGNASAQYCTPPSFLSGPYTGIINVNFAGINNSTPGTDGYTDYTAGTAGSVELGQSYSISIDVEHTIINSGFSDMVNLRVWIDWNGDQDFLDAGEEVVAQQVDLSGNGASNTANFTGTVNVPSGATVGSTRMRVYEDMLVSDGHETPNPCGYSSGIGQHGEAEDYTINITSGGGASIQEDNNLTIFNIFPNPAVESFTLQFNLQQSEEVNVEVYDLLGQRILQSQSIFNSGLNTMPIDAADLKPGIYIISLSTSEGRITKEVTIQ